MTSTKLGSPYYQSPNMLEQDEYDAFEADLWSMGIFLFEIATG